MTRFILANENNEKIGVEHSLKAKNEAVGKGVVYKSPHQIDPEIRCVWAEAIDLSEIRNIEDQTEFRSLRAQLGIEVITFIFITFFFAKFQRVSAETLSRYNVKGHMDGYDQPALCYPRYRAPATRNRVPTGLKVIRRVGEKLEKENYPQSDEYFLTFFYILVSFYCSLLAKTTFPEYSVIT